MIEVIILDYPSTMPDSLLNAGLCKLDIEPSQFRLTKQSGELNELNELKVDGTQSIDIALDNAKHRILFTNELVNNEGCEKTYNVAVKDGSYIWEMHTVTYQSANESQGTITIVLAVGDQHWYKKLQAKKTTDISFGSPFQLSRTNLLDNWQNNSIWQNGEPLYMFAPAIYGTNIGRAYSNGDTSDLRARGSLHVSDFRPWVSLYGCLKDLFCQIGWNLNMSFFETEMGRGYWCYLLSETFYKANIKSQRGKRLRWKAGTTTDDNGFYVDSKTGGDYHDFNGNYQLFGAVVQRWFNPLPYTIEMQCTVIATIEATANATVSVSFNTYNSDNDLTQEVFAGSEDLLAGETKTITFSETVLVNSGEYLIEWATNDGAVVWKAGSTTEGEMATGCYMTDDDVDVNEAIAEYEAIDLFKAAVHLCNGKIDTDWHTKTVNVYPSEKSTLRNGETWVPFYNEVETVDATIVAKSLIHTSNKIDQKRYYELKFKNSTDPTIAELNIGETLYSKVIDYGSDLEGKETSENPLFEPTLVKEISLVANYRYRNTLMKLPYLSDNTDRKLSYSIKPRIIAHCGYGSQTFYDYSRDAQMLPGNLVKYSFESEGFFTEVNPQDNWSFLTDISNNSQANDYFMGLEAVIPYQNVAYGDKAGDLFYLCYYNSLIQKGSNEKLSLLLNMSKQEFYEQNFRKKLQVKYTGRSMNLHLKSITDFDVTEKYSTPVNLVPANENKKFDCNCSKRYYSAHQEWLTITFPEPDDYEIYSVLLEGIEQLGGPVNLGPKNVVSISGFSYVTNLADTINSLEIANLGAEYLVDLNAPLEPKRVRIFMPSCIRVDIRIRRVSNNNIRFRYTHLGYSEWSIADSNWFMGQDSVNTKYGKYDEKIIQENINQCK